MASKLNPYISFAGQAREALELYHGVFGGTMTATTFGEAGAPIEGADDLLMHGSVDSENGFTLMVSDAPPGMERPTGSNIAVSLSGDDADLLRGYFEQLSDGGTVTMALEKQMWGDVFGMCTDRFGVQWMVNIAGDAA